MSEAAYPLHALIVERFSTEFGEPMIIVGKNVQWSLVLTDGKPPINLLVNIGNGFPSVWIFDPHDAKDGVRNYTVSELREATGLLSQIKQRVSDASGKPPLQ